MKQYFSLIGGVICIIIAFLFILAACSALENPIDTNYFQIIILIVVGSLWGTVGGLIIKNKL